MPWEQYCSCFMALSHHIIQVVVELQILLRLSLRDGITGALSLLLAFKWTFIHCLPL